MEIAVAKLACITGASITVGMTPAGILGAITAGSALSATLDPSLRKVIVSGNWEAAADHMSNHLPIFASCKSAMEAYKKGNYKTACVFGMLALAESYGLAKGIKQVVTGATRATTVQNHTKQGGATKIPGATVKLPISYTRSQKVFGKNVKNIVTRQRNNGKGRAYNIEFEDGTKIDINPDRVKIQVIEPKNPRGGIANHNFAKKGGLPEGTKVLGTAGNNRYKRTLTQEEVKLLEDLKELIKNE